MIETVLILPFLVTLMVGIIESRRQSTARGNHVKSRGQHVEHSSRREFPWVRCVGECCGSANDDGVRRR
jgi:hypothetical protein